MDGGERKSLTDPGQVEMATSQLKLNQDEEKHEQR